jgi:hypothetical protein
MFVYNGMEFATLCVVCVYAFVNTWNNYKIKQQLDRMEDRLDIILDVVEE